MKCRVKARGKGKMKSGVILKRQRAEVHLEAKLWGPTTLILFCKQKTAYEIHQ